MSARAKRFFLILSAAIIFLGLSAYFAKKLKPKDEVIYIPAQQAPVVASAPPVTAPVVNSSPAVANVKKECVMQGEYVEKRRDLGFLVNDHLLRQQNRKKFAAKIEKWRKSSGLPLSLGIDAEVAEKSQIVFNNCKPACKGRVHQVFVSSVIGNKFVEVMTKDGKLKKFPLHTSGLEILTIDELNKKGIPFRSWFVPMDSGPWFLKGKNLYVGLDIEGVWLKVTDKGKWSVEPIEKNVPRLISMDPLKVIGCTKEDLCLANLKEKRYFKAPQVCSSVVSHASDDVTEARDDSDAPQKQ